MGKACIQKKKSVPSINGVTVRANGDGGCWCEKGMTKVSPSGVYKTCFLKSKPVEVSCGRHKAPDCKWCPQGRGASGAMVTASGLAANVTGKKTLSVPLIKLQQKRLVL